MDAMDRCIRDLCGAELLETRSGRAALTRRGRLLANDVGARLLWALEEQAAATAGTR